MIAGGRVRRGNSIDGRVDHVFNEEHREFVRYSYLRDNDTPVTFLPDGSGNLASRVCGLGC
jgi:hypothetical protein